MTDTEFKNHNPRRIGIMNPGGGSACRTQAGINAEVKRWLRRAGKQVHAYSGASGGSANSTLAAMDQEERAIEMWITSRRSDIMPLPPLYSSKRLQNLIDQNVDLALLQRMTANGVTNMAERIEKENQGQPYLFIQCCEFRTGRGFTVQPWDQNFNLWLAGSMAHPGAVPPVGVPVSHREAIEGHGGMVALESVSVRWIQDGGIYDNNPLDPLISAGCDLIIVAWPHTRQSYGNNRWTKDTPPRFRSGTLKSTVSTLIAASGSKDLDRVKRVNARVDAGKALPNERKIEILNIYPTVDIGTLDFNVPRELSIEAIEGGRMAARKALQGRF